MKLRQKGKKVQRLNTRYFQLSVTIFYDLIYVHLEWNMLEIII